MNRSRRQAGASTPTSASTTSFICAGGMNVIIYLNRDWREDYNGSLELWSRDMKHAVQRIAPRWNRCVIFNTDANRGTVIPTRSRRRMVCFDAHGAVTTTRDRRPSRKRFQSLDHVVARPSDDNAIRSEAKSLRMAQHLAGWVPAGDPSLLQSCDQAPPGSSCDVGLSAVASWSRSACTRLPAPPFGSSWCAPALGLGGHPSSARALAQC
jgi:hypothetical protein